MNPFKLLVIFLLFPISTFAQVKLDDALIRALPSPMNFLARSNEAGQSVEQGLLKFLSLECPHLASHPQAFTERGCEILDLSHRYEMLVRHLKNGDSGVQITATPTVKPWDLSVLLAGQFIVVPNAERADAGRELMLDLFTTRDQILSAIERSYIWAKKTAAKPTTPELTMITPFMRAYFLTSTPLGALNETFRSLRCELNDHSCEIMKRLWGAVCYLAVEDSDQEFMILEARMTAIKSDTSSTELTRTQFIQSLADYVEQGHLDRSVLSAKIDELEGAGQSGFFNPDYAAVTMAVLSYNEFKQLMALKYNCLSYADELTPKTKSLYKTRLHQLTKASLDSVESALVTYGLNHELGGQQ